MFYKKDCTASITVESDTLSQFSCFEPKNVITPFIKHFVYNIRIKNFYLTFSQDHLLFDFDNVE